MDPRGLSTSPTLLTMLYLFLLRKTYERNKPAFAACTRNASLTAGYRHLVQAEHGWGMEGERNRDFPLPKHRKRNPECRENTKELSYFSSFIAHPCQKNSQPNHICASHKMYVNLVSKKLKCHLISIRCRFQNCIFS